MDATSPAQSLSALRAQLAVATTGRTKASSPILSLSIPEIDRKLAGGLARYGMHEVIGAAAPAFALYLARRTGKSLIWISTLEQETAPFPDTLKLQENPMIFVQCKRQDAAWALEQILRANAAPVVIAEMTDPPDFTASRRLQLAAREGQTLGLLLLRPRRTGRLPTSAAETRWRITPASSHCPWDAPEYHFELQKNKIGPLGQWEIKWDATTCGLRLATKISERFDHSPTAILAR